MAGGFITAEHMYLANKRKLQLRERKKRQWVKWAVFAAVLLAWLVIGR